MKKLSSSLIALSFLTALTANAATPANSSGHAVSLCKAEAKLAHEGYKRAKASKIKLTRGVYQIKLKVITESESVKSICEIAKDGNMTYSIN